MQVNVVQPSKVSYKEQPDEISKTNYLLTTIATNGIAGSLVGAGFGYFPKVDKDEFAKVGSEIKSVTEKLKDQTDVEWELKQLFKKGEGKEFEEAMKAVKKQKAVKLGTMGLIICSLGGLFIALVELHNAKKAMKK